MNSKRWVIKIFILSFFLAIVFSLGTNAFVTKFNLPTLIIITIFIILIGIIFDMIGTSTLTCKESIFHSMAAKKIHGAKKCVKLIKNSATVSSVCNDVVGDICGIISGAMGVAISNMISAKFNISLSLITIIMAAIISSLTVGGKALGKEIAIKYCDKILITVGKMLSIFNNKK